MRQIAEHAIDTAQAAGASYADSRVVHRIVETVSVKNGMVAAVGRHDDEGIGVRVICDGAWGFAATGKIDVSSVDAAVERAVRIAKASARINTQPVRLAPVAAVVGEYHSPFQIDPFTVPLEQKIALLMRADQAMARVTGIKVRLASLEAVREHRYFASTDGSRIEQTMVECGGGMDATAASPDELQIRSFPNSFGRHQQCIGYEFIEAMGLEDNGERIASEAVALLSAPRCPAGTMTVILDGTQAALQVHESCGHPTEMDRVLGSEAAYAGTSFLIPDMLKQFRYGSEQVTITADATRAHGLGTYGWDDEGVAAQRVVLVDHGMFNDYMTSRETAATLDTTSNGTMRAWGWGRLPLVRMTNVNLEPGDSSLEAMIAGTERGVYLETNRSWSIDDRRLNFQFGTQVGWEIKDGRRLGMVRNPLYSGVTPEFWNSCDAVAGLDEWNMWGVVNCFKGQPAQAMHVGHGAAPARFQNVKVRPA